MLHTTMLRQQNLVVIGMAQYSSLRPYFRYSLKIIRMTFKIRKKGKSQVLVIEIFENQMQEAVQVKIGCHHVQ